MLRLSSVCLSVVCTECIVAKRYVLQGYNKSYYWQPIGSRIWEIHWYQNEWPWPLFWGRFKDMSTTACIQRWISRKPLGIEAWFQRTTNRKWHIGYQMVTWLMTSGDPKGQIRDPNTLRAQYLENSWRCFLATIANYYLWCEAVRSAILATAWLLVINRLRRPVDTNELSWVLRVSS